MEGFVNIKDFVQYLEQNNLVVVDKKLFDTVVQEDLQVKRSRLLKQPSITLREIIDAKLLPLSTKQSVRHWIKNEIIKPNEVLKAKNGQIKILSSAIKRLGYV